MDFPKDRPRKAGFSLIEMLIVVVIIGLIALFSFPRAAAVMDHAMVKSGRTTIVNKFNAARVAARSSNRISVLRCADSNIWVELNRLSGTLKDTVGGFANMAGTANLGNRDGVSVTCPDSIRVDPRGMVLSISGTGKYVITKNGWSDSVTINNYGRVTR